MTGIKISDFFTHIYFFNHFLFLFYWVVSPMNLIHSFSHISIFTVFLVICYFCLDFFFFQSIFSIKMKWSKKVLIIKLTYIVDMFTTRGREASWAFHNFLNSTVYIYINVFTLIINWPTLTLLIVFYDMVVVISQILF